MACGINIFSELCEPLEVLPTNVSAKLVPSDGVKAVVFDIYGTLFLSGCGDIGVASECQKGTQLRQIIQKVFQIAVPESEPLTERFLDLINRTHQQLKKQGVTYPEVDIREVWADLVSPYVSPSLEQLEEVAVTYEAMINPVWPMPELLSVLERIHERGVKLGIVSNAQFYTPFLFPAFIGKTLEELHFDDALSVYSYQERQAKPGVHLYQKLSHRLAAYDIAPHEVLYVGNDRRNDVWPAHEVGFKTVLFAGDARSLRFREEMGLPAPDAIVTNLAQVLELF